MRTAFVCAVVLTMGTAAVRAQAQDHGLPPADQVEQALDRYPGVAAAGARLEAARAQADILRAGPNEFIVTGGYARRSVEREGRYDEMDAIVSHTIRLPGKAGLDRKAGRLGVEVARNKGEDVRHHAALLLADLWFDWLAAGELLRTDQDTVATQEAALNAMQRRADMRDAALLDVDQARAAVGLAQAQLADSRARLETARVTLAATFPEIQLAPEPPALPPPERPQAKLTDLRDLVIDRSHEIRAAAGEAERLAALAGRAHQDRIPDPTVGMRVFSERGGLEKGVGVSVSIPLGWEHRRATAARASADASAADFDMREVRRQIYATANADLANVETRLTAWTSMKASAQSAGDAAARTDRGHALGAIDLADLLYARRQAYDARRAEVAARAEASRAVAKILIDSHSIWAAHDDDDGDVLHDDKPEDKPGDKHGETRR